MANGLLSVFALLFLAINPVLSLTSKPVVKKPVAKAVKSHVAVKMLNSNHGHFDAAAEEQRRDRTNKEEDKKVDEEDKKEEEATGGAPSAAPSGDGTMDYVQLEFQVNINYFELMSLESEEMDDKHSFGVISSPENMGERARINDAHIEEKHTEAAVEAAAEAPPPAAAALIQVKTSVAGPPAAAPAAAAVAPAAAPAAEEEKEEKKEEEKIEDVEDVNDNLKDMIEKKKEHIEEIEAANAKVEEEEHLGIPGLLKREIAEATTELLMEYAFAAGGPAAAAPGPAVAPPAAAPAAAFLTTKRNLGAAAPAPAAAPAAGPAAAPAAGPAPEPPFTVVVQFEMGDEAKVEVEALLAARKGNITKKELLRTALLQAGKKNRKVAELAMTKIDVGIVEKKGNGIDEGPIVTDTLKKLHEDGILEKKLESAIAQVTGIWPEISKFSVDTEEAKQWAKEYCEPHVRRIVDLGSVEYTRAQVPFYVYHSCTDFMTQVSFSHDLVVNARDRTRCRLATQHLMQSWKGNNTGADYTTFCVDVCEFKFGFGSPRCHVDEGMKLAEKQH